MKRLKQKCPLCGGILIRRKIQVWCRGKEEKKEKKKVRRYSE